MSSKLPRAFELSEILTEEEISDAHRLYKKSKRKFYAACREQIVDPAWDRISGVLGPCCPRYVTYGIEYRCRKPSKKRKYTEKFVDGLMSMTGRRRGRRKQQEDRTQWASEIYAGDSGMDSSLWSSASG